MAIMKRIKCGEFRTECSSSHSSSSSDSAWKFVSSSAKQLVRGLLTVDPKKRLNLEDLFSSPWINQHNKTQISSSTLLTPSVLNDKSTDRDLLQTFNAFHRVTREGGMALLNKSSVNNNSSNVKLSTGQLRCKVINKNSSTASSSGCSSLSSLSSSSCSLSPTKQLPPCSLSPTKQLAHNPWFFQNNSTELDSILRANSRINDYLSSLSSSSSHHHYHHHHHHPFLPTTSSSSNDPSQSSSSPVSITPLPVFSGSILGRQLICSKGPVTRSRKRKMKSDVVSITKKPNNNNNNNRILTQQQQDNEAPVTITIE